MKQAEYGEREDGSACGKLLEESKQSKWRDSTALVGGRDESSRGTDWNHTTDSNAQRVMKIQEHRESHRSSLLSKRWRCKAATSPLRAVEKAGQSSTCKVGRTTVGTQRFTLRLGWVQALSSGDTELQGIVDGLAQRIRAKQ